MFKQIITVSHSKGGLVCGKFRWKHRRGCCENLNFAHTRKDLGPPYFAVSFTVLKDQTDHHQDGHSMSLPLVIK